MEITLQALNSGLDPLPSQQDIETLTMPLILPTMSREEGYCDS